jgi:aquaporin Z
MKKAIAEFIGTFALVFIGCGTIVVGGMATGSTAINELAIALAFRLTIVAMAYGIGQISGCHVNPAVSFGVYSAGRMTLEELLIYCVAQIAGAIAAALVLYVILSGKASGWNGALGQTTWSDYGAFSAFIFEVIGTFLFSRLHPRRHSARCTCGVGRDRDRTDTRGDTPRRDQYLWIIPESRAVAWPGACGFCPQS